MAHTATVNGPKSYTLGPTNTRIEAGKPVRLNSPREVALARKSGFLSLEADPTPTPKPAALPRRAPPIARPTRTPEPETDDELEVEAGEVDSPTITDSADSDGVDGETDPLTDDDIEAAEAADADLDALAAGDSDAADDADLEAHDTEGPTAPKPKVTIVKKKGAASAKKNPKR